MVAYTGGLLSLRNYPHPVVIKAASVTPMDPEQQPILRDHNQNRVVGHGKPIVEANQLRIEGSLSIDGEERDSIISANNNGFRWQASVGGRIPNPRRDIMTVASGDRVNVNGRTIEGPVHVVKAFQWKETSFVALGADEGRTSVSVAAKYEGKVQRKKPMNEFEKWLEASGFNSDELTDKQMDALQASFEAQNKGPEAETPAVDLNKVTNAAVQAALEASRSETQRQNRIDRLFASYRDTSLSPDDVSQLRAKVESGDISEDKAHLELIQASRATPRTSNVGGMTDKNSLLALTLEAAAGEVANLSDGDIRASLIEAGANSEQVDQAMNEAKSGKFRGRSLHAMIAAACQQAGHSYYGTIGDEEIRCALEYSNRSEIRAASGFSSISLPGILSRLANKAMLAAYAEADNGGAALQIASTTSTSDFKKFTRYRMTESGVMEKVGASGEIKHGTLTEETYENQVETYGKMLSLTRQMMRNDDLNAFLQIPRMIGRQGRHSLEQAVITVLVDAPTAAGAGTTEFFHGAVRGTVNQPNYAEGAGTALSIDSLGDAYELFLNQTDSDGKPIMIDPSVLLVTTANWVLANKLYNDTEFRFTAADTTQTVGNQWKGMFRPVKSSYLHRLGATASSTQWYLLPNPTTDVSGIQVAFLDGKQTPTLDSAQTDFNTLGMQWRGYFDFGVALQDPRGIVKMKGAA